MWNPFKNKENPKKTTEIEVAIRHVTDEKGEKYMHIGDTIHLLEEYKRGADLIDVSILEQLINVLKTGM